MFNNLSVGVQMLLHICLSNSRKTLSDLRVITNNIYSSYEMILRLYINTQRLKESIFDYTYVYNLLKYNNNLLPVSSFIQ